MEVMRRRKGLAVLFSVPQKLDHMPRIREDKEQYGDHKDVSIEPNRLSIDADPEISMQIPNNAPVRIRKLPSDSLKMNPKPTRELFFLLNDLGQLSRVKVKQQRPLSLVFATRQWTSPKKGWESRRMDRIKSRSSERRVKANASSIDDSEVDVNFEVFAPNSLVTLSRDPEDSLDDQEKSRRHSSVILRNSSHVWSDTENPLKLTYNRNLTFPAYQEIGQGDTVISSKDSNGNSLENSQVVDIFQPKIEDFCQSLEPDLYKDLLKHWTEEINDQVPSSTPRPSTKPKGIILPYPRQPNSPSTRKSVTFDPETIFNERDNYSNFWLRIYAQRQQRRALRRLSAEANSVFTRRRQIGRCASRRMSKAQKSIDAMNTQPSPFLSQRQPSENESHNKTKQSRSGFQRFRPIVSSIGKFFSRISRFCCGLSVQKRELQQELYRV